MAGTITVSTISDGTNSTSSTNCIKGSAKAWILYNGSSQAVRGSYNVSSVTYSGTGGYVVNFTNAMPNVNYATLVSTSNSGGAASWAMANMGASYNQVAPTTTSVAVANIYYNSNYTDSAYFSVAIFN